MAERRARALLIAHLRMLADCLHDEADLIEDDPQVAAELTTRFRDELLAMSLADRADSMLRQRSLNGTPLDPRQLFGDRPTRRSATF